MSGSQLVNQLSNQFCPLTVFLPVSQLNDGVDVMTRVTVRGNVIKHIENTVIWTVER